MPTPAFFEDVDATRNDVVEETARRIAQLPRNMEIEEVKDRFHEITPQLLLHKDWKLILKFFRGVVAFRCSEESGRAAYDSQMMKKLSTVYGVSPSLVRRERAVAIWFQENVKLFARFLKTDENIRWYHVEELTKINEDPEVLGPEDMYQRLMRQLEHGAEKMAKMNEIEEEHDVDETAGEGSKAFFTQEAKRVRDEGLELLETGEVSDEEGEKPGRELTTKQQNFVNFLHELPCMGCGKPSPKDGHHDIHHCTTGGTGTTGFDAAVIPLCRECHGLGDSPLQFYEQVGETIERAAGRVQFMYWWGHDPVLPRTIDVQTNQQADYAAA